MRHIALTAFTALVASATLAPNLAHARPYGLYGENYGRKDNFPNWYLGLNGTMMFMEDATVNSTDRDPDFGGGGNLAIGFRPYKSNTLFDNSRFELSLGYYSTELRNTNFQFRNLTPMFNFFYDFNASGQFKPYIGAGAGISFGTLDNDAGFLLGFLADGDGDGFADSVVDTDQDGAGDTVEFLVDETGDFIPVNANLGEDDKVSFAYQLMAGFAYEFRSLPDTEFVMGYRFYDAGDNTYEVPNGTGVATPAIVDTQSHNVDVGFRFRF